MDMNYAQQAKEASVRFEAKLDGLRKNQDGTVKVTFTVNPTEFPGQFMTDSMGQRYMVAACAINEDETPRPKNEGKNYTAAAKLLANNPAFHNYVAKTKGFATCYDEGEAEQWIEYACGVKSCSEIKEGTEAGRKFAQLYAQFKEWEQG